MTRSPPTLHIGVLIPSSVQLLDLSPIDLFAMSTAHYLTACQLPAPLIALGLPDNTLRVSYIGEAVTTTTPAPAAAAAFPRPHHDNSHPAEPGTSLISTTPGLGLNVQLTHDLTHSDVAPGRLDVLYIPGPDPGFVPSEAVVRYLRAQAACPTTDILTVCTGIFVAAHAGILDGRVVTGPRPLVGMKLRGIARGAKWRDGGRWEVDRRRSEVGKGWGRGELWTSGGITNGLDMVAVYLRERVAGELVDLVCELADLEVREREYGKGKVRMGVGFMWLVVRAWWGGLWGRGGGKVKGL